MTERNENGRVILVVEHRDEVFARLAADLGRTGLRVHRAETATRAAHHHARRPADLILLSAQMPDESAWLASQKLRMTDAEVPVWIYSAWATPTDVDMANFVHADELIDYGGDVWNLTDQVADRLNDPFSPFAPAADRPDELRPVLV